MVHLFVRKPISLHSQRATSLLSCTEPDKKKPNGDRDRGRERGKLRKGVGEGGGERERAREREIGSKSKSEQICRRPFSGPPSPSPPLLAAHNACIRELLQEIDVHGKADRHMKLLTVETESRLGTL
jgi:hypothetical protein